MRCLRLVVDGVRRIWQRRKRGECPDAAVAKIDDDFGVDLLTVIGSADEEGSGLEVVVGIGRLRENGVGIFEWSENESKQEQSYNGEQEVGGGLRLLGRSFY